MAIVTLDDGEGRLELPIFSDLYDLKSDLLKEDKLVIANVRGERRVREFNGRPAGKVVEELYCLSEARRTFAKRVNLHLDNRLSSKRLKEIIAPYANGSTPLTIIYENNGVSAKLQLGEHWKLKLEDSLFEALSRSMPAKKIEIEYR